MRDYRVDLHIHTVVSACAAVEMIPPLIVAEALERGLEIIAITDHNTTANAASVIAAASGQGLTVLPGMELQTREEVDMLCIFETLEQAAAWQAVVDRHLPPLNNDAERFGAQFVVDAEGNFVREDHRLLQAPTSLTLSEAAETVKALGGLAIPAHIERPSKGLLGVLGIWPDDLDVEAAEVSFLLRPDEARARYPFLPDIPLISNSDAHHLESIGRAMTLFTLDDRPSLASLRRALREGRVRVL